MDFMVKKYGRFVYIHLYTFVTNQFWFNCDLKTHHPWRALSCWPSTWGDSCILTTLRVLTRRGLDSTFSGRLAAACQQGLITFHDIMAFRIKHSTKSRRSEGLAFLNCFLGLRHGPDGPFMAQSKKAIATETWQRLRKDQTIPIISKDQPWNIVKCSSARIQRPAHVWAPSPPTNSTDHSAAKNKTELCRYATESFVEIFNTSSVNWHLLMTYFRNKYIKYIRRSACWNTPSADSTSTTL